MMTDGRVEKFREGWALPLGSWGKAHFYTRDGVGFAVSACGLMSPYPAGAMFHAGSWHHCKKCESKLLSSPERRAA